MKEIHEVVSDVRLSFTLVPWRMRPKVVGIMIGSLAMASFDLLAVILTLPLMQVIGGVGIRESLPLMWLSDITGLTSRQGLLISLLLIIVAMFIIKNLGALLFRWWSLGVTARASADASYSMLKLYTTSPWAFHRQRRRDDIYQSMTGYIGAAFNTMNDLVILMVDTLTAVAVMVALLIVSPQATVVALVFFGGAAWLLQALLRRGQVAFGERARIANVRSWGALAPPIDGFKEARVANATDGFVREYAQTRRDTNLANRALGFLGEIPRAVLEILMIIGILVVAGFLLWTSSPEETFAFLGVFAVAALRIVPALNRAVATLGRIRSGVPNLRALRNEILTLRSEPRIEISSDRRHSFPMADIVFDDVTYTFSDAKRPVLDGVSGVIPEGHTVALVGSSGAGKTTFIDMLLGLFTPDAGEMTVQGVSIHDHPHEWWEQLGMVAQDVFVMPRSLRENIAFGVPDDAVDTENLQRAIEAAQLEDVVAEMPEGVDTVLGEQGTRVSGGQKQRIGIARALYRRPQLLVLDEATSALDNETEARITQTLQDLRGEITIVIVAHRLSTVKHADQILFFSKGKIAARGTMAELVEQNEEFANLVRLGQLN